MQLFWPARESLDARILPCRTASCTRSRSSCPMPSGTDEALAAASGNKAHVWQPFSKDADQEHFTVASEGKVYCVQWNQNNKVIVSGGQTGVVALNYNRDGALMGTLPKVPPAEDERLPAISSIAFSRGSKLLAAGCMDSTVRVWDLKQQVCKEVVESHKAAVTYVTFSTEDQHLASACLTGEIHLHNVRQSTQAAVLRTPGNRAKRSLHFTPLEPLLASGAEDGSLYVWDTTTYTLLDSYIQTHSATVSRVCFSPGSPNILISAALDKAIVLTDRRLDATIANIPCGLPLTALDCKDDGNCITVGTTQGTVLLYDPRKLQTPVMRLTCPGGEPVSSLHWQQSNSSKPAKRGSTPAVSTPAPASVQPQSHLRGQELLSAASPATPLNPSTRQTQVAGNVPADRGARAPPVRTTSAASEHSLAQSDGSFLSAQPASEKHGNALPHNDAPGSRISTDQRAILMGPSANGTSNAARAQVDRQREPGNPLFSATYSESIPADSKDARQSQARLPRGGDSSMVMAAPSRLPREDAAQEIRAMSGHLDESDSSLAARLRDPVMAMQSSERPANGSPSHSNPGFDPDIGRPALGGAERPQAEAASSSFGSRLRQLMGVQPESGSGAAAAAAAPSGGSLGQSGALVSGEYRDGGGNLPPDPSGNWERTADEIKAAISADVKTLHFEMIRQFHIQQIEMKEVMDAMINRQDTLVKEVLQLRQQIQQLTHQQAAEGSFLQ